MFGNKKTSSTGDDVQLTTRSMKSDLEGNSDDNLIHDQITIPKKDQKTEKVEEKIIEKPIKPLLPRKDLTPEINRKPAVEKLNESGFPANLPIAEKISNTFAEEENRMKMQLQDKKQETPANNFFQDNHKLEQKKNSTTPPVASQKNYDDFFKDKIKKPLPEQEAGSPSSILIIILAIVLLVAVASGAYYYFFVLNAKTAIEKPEAPAEFPVEPEIEPIQPPVEEILPIILSETKEINLVTGENLKTKLFNPQNPNSLISGFYSIKDENGILNLEKISALLEIEIPQTINTPSSKTWIYYESSATPKIGLVVNIDPTKANEIEQAILSSEQKLPTMMSGLYSTPGTEQLTENIIFKDSVDNVGFRYYNINPNPSSLKSLDWGMVADDKLLVFATSKEMAKEIKKLLSSSAF